MKFHIYTIFHDGIHVSTPLLCHHWHMHLTSRAYILGGCSDRANRYNRPSLLFLAMPGSRIAWPG